MASGGTSWTADPRGPDHQRICRALELANVRWSKRTGEWLLRHFDPNVYSQDRVRLLLLRHIRDGGTVKGQRNEDGAEFEVWFAVELIMDGQARFIKFGIEPEDDEYPGITIISTHPPH
ncbi:MAG: hypothetical protein K2Q09_04240 [Phycisphaerales bacterium]|nr:hypothetical protein [Phycisphaerales bacterium]